jgi:hypothetical protein
MKRIRKEVRLNREKRKGSRKRMRIKEKEYKTCKRWVIQKGGRKGGNCKGKRKA